MHNVKLVTHTILQHNTENSVTMKKEPLHHQYLRRLTFKQEHFMTTFYTRHAFANFQDLWISATLWSGLSIKFSEAYC